MYCLWCLFVYFVDVTCRFDYACLLCYLLLPSLIVGLILLSLIVLSVPYFIPGFYLLGLLGWLVISGLAIVLHYCLLLAFDLCDYRLLWFVVICVFMWYCVLLFVY